MAQPVPPRVILVSDLRFEPLLLGVILDEWVKIQQGKKKYTNILTQACWCQESYLFDCGQGSSIDSLMNRAVLMEYSVMFTLTYPVK